MAQTRSARASARLCSAWDSTPKATAAWSRARTSSQRTEHDGQKVRPVLACAAHALGPDSAKWS